MAAAAGTNPNIPSQARPWNPEFKHLDRERWIIIYPAYLNSKKTIQEGRKIPKAKAVENPVCSEIRDVVAAAGLTLGVENKTYPRELEPRDIRYKGRIRVQLKKEDGTPQLPQFPTRMSVMLHVAEMIPKLKSRSQAQSSSGQSQQQQQQQQGGKGQKKKGKK